MAGVNKVILLGRLGKDPEMKYGQNSNIAVCRFSLATSERYKGEEKTEWHNIVMFDRLAEIANEYLAKGRQVYIEGRIQTRKYQGNDGSDRWMTEIIANSMQMLGGGRDEGGESYGGGGRRDSGEYTPQPRREAPREAAPPRQPQQRSVPDDDPFSGDFGPPPTEDDMPF